MRFHMIHMNQLFNTTDSTIRLKRLRRIKKSVDLYVQFKFKLKKTNTQFYQKKLVQERS